MLTLSSLFLVQRVGDLLNAAANEAADAGL